jgi:hypothetical protein
MVHLLTRSVRLSAGFLAVIALSACGLHFTPTVEARDEWTRKYTLSAGGMLELREANGTFDVTAIDGDAVEVVATRIAKAADDDTAKRALARIEIREDVKPGRILVDSTSGPDLAFRESRSVNYVVRMPRQAQLTIKSTNGSIKIAGVAGRVSIATTNGEVRATGLAEATTVTATNGEISLDFARVGGAVACETTNGTIEIALPREAGAELSARVTNGAIEHSHLPVKVKEDSRRRLEATIGAGGPEIRLATTNGAISVRGR